MNWTRVAELLRQIADELDGEQIEQPKPIVKAKPRSRARTYPAPLNPVSETDKMRARQMLRRRGITA